MTPLKISGISSLLIVLVLLNFIFLISCASLLNNDKSRFSRTIQMQEPIDPSNQYFLSWEVDVAKEEITFKVEVEALGYIGFGISPTGSMVGADIFIAGVNPDGTSYSGDYHGGERNGMPILDTHNDWTLIDAKENSTHTSLVFSRLLNTCDEQDFEITTGTNKLIWSIGFSDQLSYHNSLRGSYSASLLSPVPPFDTEDEELRYFDTEVDMEMPPLDTTYWCTIHAGPVLDKTHQIIAFEAKLPTIEAKNFTHHFIFYNCYAPEGENADDFFGQHLNYPGNHCNLPSDQQRLPIAQCQEYLFAWAIGGKRMVFPDNVGFPIGEIPGQKQYYMLEIHYDNPQKVEGVKFNTGLRTYYTTKLREHDATLLTVGHMVNPSLTIPPDTNSFVISGHCSSECTDKFLPEEGVTVFSTLLHSHISGRKLKLRHFRNGVELPWIDYDDHYDFNFQQNKPVTDIVKILPGDQLTYECTYDTTWNENHEIIIGGLPSRQEMCQTYIWIYPRQTLDYCASQHPFDEGLADFGIKNFTFSNHDGQDELLITEPDELQGSYVQSISHKFNWNAEFRQKFQEKRRYNPHEYACYSLRNISNTVITGKVEYSKVSEEYVPENKCVGTSVPPTDSTTASIPDSTTASVPDSTTASIPDSTTASIPDSTTASIPDSTTASIPDSTTASIPDSTTASIPDSTTASIPDSTTDSVTGSPTDSETGSPTDSNTASVTDSTTESNSGVVNFGICLSAKILTALTIVMNYL